MIHFVSFISVALIIHLSTLLFHSGLWPVIIFLSHTVI